MIRIFLIAFIFSLISLIVNAHPGIGLVIDAKGNIYYTDLKQIWKQTPSGEKSIAVPNVHSHELYMDKNNNLFGEHLWYESATEKFFNYHWRLKSSGEFVIIKDTSEVFVKPPEYSYTRDEFGNMYWYEPAQNDTFNFIKCDTLGNKTKIASGEFNDIRWVYASPKNEIYFLDLEDLYKITTDGKFKLIAKNLCIGSVWTLFSGNQHSVFGIWFDDIDNIYVAVSEDGCVKKITPSGEITIIYKSEKGTPTAGLFDKNGNIWVLLYHGGFEASIQKIKLDEISKTKVWFHNNILDIIIIASVLTAGVFTVKKLRQRKS